MEQKSIAFIIFGIFGFLTSSFTRFRNYTYNGNINYLKNNTDIDDISLARCDDLIYGCCMIYDTCSVVDNRLTSTDLPINPEYYVCEDEKCTNCPRLHDIIQEYNNYMKENYFKGHLIECNSDLSIDHIQDNHCSKINTACDSRYYFDVFKNNNTQAVMVRLYNRQSSGPDSITYNVYPREDGSPTTIQHIWMTLQHGHLNQKEIVPFIINIILSFIGWIGFTLILLYCSDNKIFKKCKYERSSTQGYDLP